MGWLADLLKEVPLSAMLQAELKEAEAKYAKLEAELKDVKEKNAWLDAELKRVKNSGHLDPQEVEILKFIGTFPDGITAHGIERALGMPRVRVEYFLGRLIKGEYLGHFLAVGAPAEYVLEDKGNEYLVLNNLV